MSAFLLRNSRRLTGLCGSSGQAKAFHSLTCSAFTPSLVLRPQGPHRAHRVGRMGAVRTEAVAVGDKIPGTPKFNYFDHDGNMQEVTAEELTKGKKVVLFAVPGAFTPTCSSKHVPGFLEKADELKAKGVETIACVAVNDAFVMDAWGKTLGTEDKIQLLADGSAAFAKALGVDLDLSDKGLGVRSRRYAMLLDDGVVKDLNLEEGGAFTISSADAILKAL